MAGPASAGETLLNLTEAILEGLDVEHSAGAEGGVEGRGPQQLTFSLPASSRRAGRTGRRVSSVRLPQILAPGHRTTVPQIGPESSDCSLSPALSRQAEGSTVTGRVVAGAAAADSRPPTRTLADLEKGTPTTDRPGHRQRRGEDLVEHGAAGRRPDRVLRRPIGSRPRTFRIRCRTMGIDHVEREHHSSPGRSELLRCRAERAQKRSGQTATDRKLVCSLMSTTSVLQFLRNEPNGLRGSTSPPPPTTRPR